MIQPAAQPVASSTLSLAAQPAENGAPGLENGGFAELLAGQGAPGSAADQPGDPAATPTGLVAAQPDLAAFVPLTGKILPGLLPGGLPVAGPDVPADQPVPAESDAAQAPGQAMPTLLAALRALRLPEPALPGSKTTAQLPGEAGTKAATAEDDTADPLAAFGLALPGASAPAATLAAAPLAAAAVDTAPTGQTGLPPMIEAQLLGRPLMLRDAAPAAAAPAAAGKADAGPADLALRLDPARVDPAAAAALSFEPGMARPAHAVRLRPVLETETSALAATAPQTADAASLLASPVPVAAPLSAAAAPALPNSVLPHSAQPHDFAALMDRLITARDAAQTGLPQSVNIALNHADFGPVSVQFQHDQAGLAVSLASADPDFARAVQAAIPAPAAAAGSGDSAARDNGQGSNGQGANSAGWTGQGLGRGDASAAGGEAGQRQPRAASTFAPDNAGPALNRSAEARDAAPSRQRGIFA